METITYLKVYTQTQLDEFADEIGYKFEDDGSYEIGVTIAKFRESHSDEVKAVFILTGATSWRCVSVDKDISTSGDYES